MRESEILVEQQPPQGVFVCDHAGLVLNKLSRQIFGQTGKTAGESTMVKSNSGLDGTDPMSARILSLSLAHTLSPSPSHTLSHTHFLSHTHSLCLGTDPIRARMTERDEPKGTS